MSRYTVYVTKGGKLAARRIVTGGQAQKMFKQNVAPVAAQCARSTSSIRPNSARLKAMGQCMKRAFHKD